ncbi:MAG: hypothetical protein JW776_16090 [Candidatus Lokiarchaeota archaeon]|nr:hypothetical protein [Candidatus Lokiarchaeota archaeon]
MRICTNCGTTNPDSTGACKKCGSPIKPVNSVVVRTNYRKTNKTNQKTEQHNDFNPVQQQINNPKHDLPSQMSSANTPKITNLEYKFHSPKVAEKKSSNQSGLPLEPIPPTPTENFVIPRPIIPKKSNYDNSSPREENSPIVLSNKTIQNTDLQAIPQNLHREQTQRENRSSYSNPIDSSNQIPIMAFSTQSIQSQQIEQEMTSIMDSLRVSPLPKSSSNKKGHSQEDDSKLDTTIPNSLDDILINLSQLDLNIEASALVNVDGNIIASAISERIDDFLISTITNTLGTISQDVMASLESGDVKFVSIFATKGILFLSPIMKNLFLVLYTSSDAKIGLINLARMVVKKKIELFYAKRNLRKSPV